MDREHLYMIEYKELIDIVLTNPYRESLNARKVNLGDTWALKSLKPCLFVVAAYKHKLNGIPPYPSDLSMKLWLEIKANCIYQLFFYCYPTWIHIWKHIEYLNLFVCIRGLLVMPKSPNCDLIPGLVLHISPCYFCIIGYLPFSFSLLLNHVILTWWSNILDKNCQLLLDKAQGLYLTRIINTGYLIPFTSHLYFRYTFKFYVIHLNISKCGICYHDY